jgi:hypothetical protein
MSWFKKKPVDPNISDLLAREEYLDDFVASQKASEEKMKKNATMMKLESCADLQVRSQLCLYVSCSFTSRP